MGNPVITKQRSQQSNFETVLQVISMRGQPEEIEAPEKTMESLKAGQWGTEYRSKAKIPVWRFTFEVGQQDVFSDGQNQLGNLDLDCQDVPMIKGLEEWANVSEKLNVSAELRNISFEIAP